MWYRTVRRVLLPCLMAGAAACGTQTKRGASPSAPDASTMPPAPDVDAAVTPEGGAETCAPDGTLTVRSLAVSGWQDLDLPRETYNDESAARRRLDGQLRAMFARVKSALHAWTEVMDHFG
jgi:hypothetical protein